MPASAIARKVTAMAARCSRGGAASRTLSTDSAMAKSRIVGGRLRSTGTQSTSGAHSRSSRGSDPIQRMLREQWELREAPARSSRRAARGAVLDDSPFADFGRVRTNPQPIPLHDTSLGSIELHSDRACMSLPRVICRWCGCTTTDGNHGSQPECTKALRREIELLRLELQKRSNPKKLSRVMRYGVQQRKG